MTQRNKITTGRINQYRIMWVFVYFDLPVESRDDRYQYSVFRQRLLKDGFIMMQYSIYARHTNSREQAILKMNKIEEYLPKRGKISMHMITDRQYGMMRNYYGGKPKNKKTPVGQLLMF